MDIQSVITQSLITSSQLAAVFAVPVAILYVLHLLMLKTLGNHGARRWHLISGVVGVPVHELSHMCFVMLSGMKIEDFALFKPDPKSGSLGYVTYLYNPHSWLHIFATALVGLAPLIIGLSCVTFLFGYIGGVEQPVWFNPQSPLNMQFWTLDPLIIAAQHLVEQGSIFQWAALWGLISIAMHCCPSKADLIPGFKAYIGLTIIIIMTHLFLLMFSQIDVRIIGGIFPIIKPYLFIASQWLVTVIIFMIIGYVTVCLPLFFIRLISTALRKPRAMRAGTLATK